MYQCFLIQMISNFMTKILEPVRRDRLYQTGHLTIDSTVLAQQTRQLLRIIAHEKTIPDVQRSPGFAVLEDFVEIFAGQPERRHVVGRRCFIES